MNYLFLVYIIIRYMFAFALLGFCLFCIVTERGAGWPVSSFVASILFAAFTILDEKK